MKYHQIDRDLFIKSRAKFTAQMKPNSVAVFNSNDIQTIDFRAPSTYCASNAIL